MTKHNWTDERIEELKTLWADGLSCNQIARALGGVTRNAVIGKVSRLGLPGRASQARPRPGPRVYQPRAVPPPKVVPIALDPFVFENGDVVTIENVVDGMCRYPIGDPLTSGFRLCGNVCTGVYCDAHAICAHQPPKAA